MVLTARLNHDAGLHGEENTMSMKGTRLTTVAAVCAIVTFTVASGLTLLLKDKPHLTLAATAVCVACFAAWFLAAFTGDAREKTSSMFVFAYLFTFASFVLLVLPPTESDALNGLSPLAIVRGCAIKGADDPGLVPYPRSMLCEPGTPAAAAAPAANAVFAPAATGGAATVCPAPSSSGYLALLVVGGVSGERGPVGCCAVGKQCLYVRISSGLAVPMYVIVLAFVGGAVSLSRRIPEYQKRSDATYQATDEQPALAAVDAREAVVFQIMQLISAPFIALSAYYIVGPSTLGAAVGLAFACGFASEPILLMIRGAITGIRPESTKLLGSVLTRLTGTVSNDQGPVEGATVTVAELPGLTAVTNQVGQFTVADLSAGSYTLAAMKGTQRGSATVVVDTKPAEVIISLAEPPANPASSDKASP